MARLLSGGSGGNEQLTAIAGVLVFLLLVIEGATLLDLRSLLSVHAFVGMLLIPVVATKLASTGWRMTRYYLGRAEYVLRGPPHVLLRAVVAPVLAASTIVLLATGVVLLALDQTHGTIVGLHKASFVVWLPAFGLHLLTRAHRLLPLLRQRLPGAGVRLALATCTLLLGVALATETLPAADHLQDKVVGAELNDQ